MILHTNYRIFRFSKLIHLEKLWAGPSGTNPEFPDLSGDRPIITYVATSEVTHFSCDLMDVIDDAAAGMYGGYSLTTNMYLTDVFAGFTIWGGNPTGSTVNEFTVNVNTP